MSLDNRYYDPPRPSQPFISQTAGAKKNVIVVGYHGGDCLVNEDDQLDDTSATLYSMPAIAATVCGNLASP